MKNSLPRKFSIASRFFYPNKAGHKVALEDVAVGNPKANRKSRINQVINRGSPEIVTNECQAGVGTEVVKSLFIMKLVMFGFTFSGELNVLLSC